MIVAVGLDLVDTSRIAQLCDRYDQRLVAKLLGPEEIVLYERRPDRVLFLAGRFAAKEAVIKSLAGIRENRPPFPTIQILPDRTGRPNVQLAEVLQGELSGFHWIISITHERMTAAAVAILLKD